MRKKERRRIHIPLHVRGEREDGASKSLKGGREGICDDRARSLFF